MGGGMVVKERGKGRTAWRGKYGNMHEKNSANMQHIWHYGTTFGAYRPVPYILRKFQSS